MEKISEKTENQRGTNKEYEREEHKRNRAKTKTTKYKIGISEYRDKESDMLSELTKIEENRDIKLLQRVILQSKDRNGRKTEQETDALKKQVPERNRTINSPNKPGENNKTGKKNKLHTIKIKQEEIEKSASNLYKFFTKNDKSKEIDLIKEQKRNKNETEDTKTWEETDSQIPRIEWQ